MTEANKQAIYKKIKRLTAQISRKDKQRQSYNKKIVLIEKQIGFVNAQRDKAMMALSELGRKQSELKRKLAYCVCVCNKCMHQENCCYGCKLTQSPNMPSKQQGMI